MTTQNALNVGLSGSTGTGSFVGATSPTITTANIIGVADASSASAGSVGQVISSSVTSGSGVSLTSNTATNVTSILLTAGDWDVSGNVTTICSTASDPFTAVWTSLTNATLPDRSLRNGHLIVQTSSSQQNGMEAPYLRVNVNTTTTVYLSAQCNFSGGTTTACGNIFARRVR